MHYLARYISSTVIFSSILLIPFKKLNKRQATANEIAELTKENALLRSDVEKLKVKVKDITADSRNLALEKETLKHRYYCYLQYLFGINFSDRISILSAAPEVIEQLDNAALQSAEEHLEQSLSAIRSLRVCNR